MYLSLKNVSKIFLPDFDFSAMLGICLALNRFSANISLASEASTTWIMKYSEPY